MSFDLKIIAGDLQVKNGDLSILTGSGKLEQDLTKIALTDIGSNPIQPWYGSLISNNLIGSSLPTDIVISSIKSQLERSINILKQLQDNQVASGQKTSPNELISYVSGISVLQNPQDLRTINVAIKVLSRAFGTIITSLTV